MKILFTTGDYIQWKISNELLLIENVGNNGAVVGVKHLVDNMFSNIPMKVLLENATKFWVQTGDAFLSKTGSEFVVQNITYLSGSVRITLTRVLDMHPMCIPEITLTRNYQMI